MKRATLLRSPLGSFLCSLKVTTTCLFLLFVLTTVGTFYQVEFGLHAAQQRYFTSWFLLLGGFLPFPGGQLVLWILGVNLTAVLILRLPLKRNYIGLWIIHIGLIVLLLGAFITHLFARESFVSLAEGHGVNYSTAYHTWELALLPIGGNTEQKQVKAITLTSQKPGTEISFEPEGIHLKILHFIPNARPTDNGPLQGPFSNRGFSAVRKDKEPAQNMPAVVFQLGDTQYGLWAADKAAIAVFDSDSTQYALSLRRARYPLPFHIRLDEFHKLEHPGTSIARSFDSWVTMSMGPIERKVHIYMNHPLRYKNFTLFQASYQIDQNGTEFSTFAVVENAGKLLPYISSSIIGLGLAWHFCAMLLSFARKKSPKGVGGKKQS